MADMVQKAEGWVVYDENGRHVYATEAEAKAHCDKAPKVEPEPEDEPDAG